MKTPEQIALDHVDDDGSDLAKSMVSTIVSAIEADRAQRTLVDAVAEVLDDRGAASAAQLVRDTDPDDDLWNNYFGPMLDSLETDYTKIAKEMGQ